MLNFFQSLLSGDERDVDSVIVCGVVALAALIGVTVFAVWQDHSLWNPLTFATGAGTLITSVAGGKTARDRWAGNPPQAAPVDAPKTDDPK